MLPPSSVKMLSSVHSFHTTMIIVSSAIRLFTNALFWLANGPEKSGGCEMISFVWNYLIWLTLNWVYVQKALSCKIVWPLIRFENNPGYLLIKDPHLWHSNKFVRQTFALFRRKFIHTFLIILLLISRFITRKRQPFSSQKHLPSRLWEVSLNWKKSFQSEQSGFQSGVQVKTCWEVLRFRKVKICKQLVPRSSCFALFTNRF